MIIVMINKIMMMFVLIVKITKTMDGTMVNMIILNHDDDDDDKDNDNNSADGDWLL